MIWTFLLAPIVTLHSHDNAAAANRIRIDEQTCVDFWFLQLNGTATSAPST